MATIDGTEDPDTLKGTEVADIMNGLGGDDTLRGREGDDRLNGGEGLDLMIGRHGDDIYTVDETGDRVLERAGEGVDEVRAAASFVLRPHVENLALLGTGDFFGFGNAGANRITGNGGDNYLDGRGGADRLEGGAGNDVYVSRAGTTIVEEAEGGRDLVLAYASIVLSDHVEEVWLRGSAANATGNALDNLIRGTDLANAIDGGGGRDILIGGGGNDRYIVADPGAKAIEEADGGIDTVESSTNYTLGAYVENLVLTGIRGSDGRGNALDNVIEGNDGNNRLSGGAGADTMRGGSGNDSYYVDNANDVIEDAAGQADTIYASVSYTLPEMDNFDSYVENLVLLGISDINATGSDGINTLTGNSGDNILTGGNSDTLIGGDGNDTLVATSLYMNFEGGAGQDIIEIRYATNISLLHKFLDFDPTDDSIALDVDEFTGISIGVLPSDQFVIGTQAEDADDRIIYDFESGRLYFDADGSGSESRMLQLATLELGTPLDHTDFFGF